MHSMNTKASSPPAADPPCFYDAQSYSKDTSVGFLMKRCLGVLVRNLDHRMQLLDLTGTQWHPLIHVLEGCDTVAACAREMQTDAGGMTRMLDRLEAKGLLARSRSTVDRRVVHLALTPKGREVAQQVPAVLAAVLNEHLRGFSGEEFATLMELLRRFAGNGEALAAASNAGPGPRLTVRED